MGIRPTLRRIVSATDAGEGARGGRSVATIKDVARLAGVSTATVSATLNKSAYVSPEYEARVVRAVDLLGYAPSGIARSLKTGVTRLIGLIVADITNPFFTQLVHRIEAAAKLEGYSVILCDTDEDIGQELNFIRLLRKQRVDGLILAPTGQAADYDVASVRGLDLPVVLVDRLVPVWPTDAVLLDNVAAGRLAAKHLLDLGHRRIGIVTGAPHLTSAAERLDGFSRALHERAVPLAPQNVRYAHFREDAAFAESRDMLAAADRPTAVLVANNLMLIGFLRALNELGLACPDDVSIVTIDDLPWAKVFTPPLTAIRQPIDSMAEQAFRMLLARLPKAGDSAPIVTRSIPELIVRRSCAPMRER
jgi:LacI family transcriptional regulator